MDGYKCGEGEGDCDKDSDCKTGLVCKEGGCPLKVGTDFQKGDECCGKPGKIYVNGIPI